MSSNVKDIWYREVRSSLEHRNRVLSIHVSIWPRSDTTVTNLGLSRWRPTNKVHKNQKCCKTTVCVRQHVSPQNTVMLLQYSLGTERKIRLLVPSTNFYPACCRHGVNGAVSRVPSVYCSSMANTGHTMHQQLWTFWQEITFQLWPILHITHVQTPVTFFLPFWSSCSWRESSYTVLKKPEPSSRAPFCTYLSQGGRVQRRIGFEGWLCACTLMRVSSKR